MTEERKRILEMLANGKINVNEASDLLAALTKPSESNPKQKPRYLRVLVEAKDPDSSHEAPQKVNIRIPMQLLYAGVKLAGLIPSAAHGPINKALREKGINLDVSQLKTNDLEELVANLSEMRVDVDQKDQKVQVFCE